MVEFGCLRPMLAQTADAPFSSDQYAFEVKWDGYRALAYVGDSQVRFQSRQGKDLTKRFVGLQRSDPGITASGAVVDGEIVALHERRSSFHHLRRGQGTLVYVAFDLLASAGGQLIINECWQKRRQLLEDHWSDSQLWQLSPLVDDGQLLWQVVVEQGLEGMMAKTKRGAYLPGQRSAHWLKVPNRHTLDCVIIGLLPGRERPIASVGVAVYREQLLLYLGQVGSGLTERSAHSILSSAKVVADPPLDRIPPESLIWLNPSIVCTVEYLEITPDGRLRHPVFRQLRMDLQPQDCRWPSKGEAL